MLEFKILLSDHLGDKLSVGIFTIIHQQGG